MSEQGKPTGPNFDTRPVYDIAPEDDPGLGGVPWQEPSPTRTELVVWRCPDCDQYSVYPSFPHPGECQATSEPERIPVIPKSEAEQLVWKMGEQLRETEVRYEALEARVAELIIAGDRALDALARGGMNYRTRLARWNELVQAFKPPTSKGEE